MTVRHVKIAVAILLFLTGLYVVIDLREFLGDFKPTAFYFSYLIGRLLVAGLFAGAGYGVLRDAWRSAPSAEMRD